MNEWSQARDKVLLRLDEVRRSIAAKDEEATLALVNEQDAFCDAAKEERSHSEPSSEKMCHYCQGYVQSGGCMGRLAAIDRAVLGREWDAAAKLVDEYARWVGSLSI